MELKNIEKINSYYEIVKLLDKEIINLQKSMRKVFDNELGATLTLNIDKVKEAQKYKDPYEAIEEVQQRVFDHLRQGGFIAMSFDHGGIIKPNKVKSENDFVLANGELLAVLELLLRQKESRRNKLLMDLEKMGVKIK